MVLLLLLALSFKLQRRTLCCAIAFITVSIISGEGREAREGI